MSRGRADGGEPASASGDYMRQVSLRWQLDVHPGRSLEVDEAVRDEMNGRLMRYDERLGGVMLSYWDERIVTRQVQVLELMPYIRAVVTANALVFRPRVGTLLGMLDGVVNEVRDDFLHLLVFGVFHVSIGRGRIRKDFNFVPDPASGLFALQSTRDRRHRVVGGARIRFAVAGVDAFAQELVSFTGAMEGEDTGSVEYLDSAAGTSGGASGGDAGESGRKKKKRSRDDEGGGGAHQQGDNGAVGNGGDGPATDNGGGGGGDEEREGKRRKKDKKEKKEKKEKKKRKDKEEKKRPTAAAVGNDSDS